MIYVLLAVIAFLYVCGAFLMRAMMKIGNTTDQDDWKPILTWPLIVFQAVGEAIYYKQFEW